MTQKTYNVQEALEILQREGIAQKPDSVWRWLRRGDLKGERSEYRKEGWKIKEDDLMRFIRERKEKSYHVKMIDELRRKVAALEKENQELKERLARILASSGS